MSNNNVEVTGVVTVQDDGLWLAFQLSNGQRCGAQYNPSEKTIREARAAFADMKARGVKFTRCEDGGTSGVWVRGPTPLNFIRSPEDLIRS